MAAYRRVYDSRHLQADCQDPGSAPKHYARQSSMGYLFYYHVRSNYASDNIARQLSLASRVSDACSAAHQRAAQRISAQHICVNGTLYGVNGTSRCDVPDVARFCPPVCRITSRAGAWCVFLRIVRVELRRVHVQSDAVPAGYRRQRVRQHAHGHRLRQVCTPRGMVWYGKCRAL